MKPVRIVLVVVALIVGGLIGAACSEFKDARGIGDAPAHQLPDKVRTIAPNADRYANVSAFCIGETGIYTTTGNQRDAMDPVRDDPNCDRGGFLAEERDENVDLSG